ncbi:MAG: hypothetical protein ACOY4O_08250 [Pseudomonadota bacterium]|jgi:hypothetical protein
MAAKTRMIEVDATTASTLQDRAAAQGMSVSELVAGMTALGETPASVSDADLADLDREWAMVKAGDATIAHRDVAQWLKTWGTPAFKPWSGK